MIVVSDTTPLTGSRQASALGFAVAGTLDKQGTSRFDFAAGFRIRLVMRNGISIEIPVPAALSGFKLPAGVQRRLTALLDRQDSGTPLTSAERREAEGLVEMAEFLSLLKLRSKRSTKAA